MSKTQRWMRAQAGDPKRAVFFAEAMRGIRCRLVAAEPGYLHRLNVRISQRQPEHFLALHEYRRSA
jgi:hypothetical protein